MEPYLYEINILIDEINLILDNIIYNLDNIFECKYLIISSHL
jgi:hypothetical protein